jgi:hypothetical protein
LTVIGVAESLEGTELADRIRRLCVELGRGELAGIIRHAGAEPLLERLLRMLAAEKADPAEVAAILDTLDEAAVQAGIDGLTTGTRGYRPVTWPVGAPQYGWVCPQRRCSRAETESANGGDTLVCAITGAPLTRIRLTE